MTDRQTTVITDIMEYATEILPHIHRVVDRNNLAFHTALTPECIVKWFIAKVYWEVYHYDVMQIFLQDTAMLSIFHEVDQSLNGRLIEITCAHLKVLKSFDQYREIDIEIKGRDLYTYYYGIVHPSFHNLQQWT